MGAVILKLLKDEWAALLVIAVLIGGGVWLGSFITSGKLAEQKSTYEQTLRQREKVFSDAQAQWQEQKIAASDQYAADLKEALRQRDIQQARADELTAQLAKSTKDSERRISDITRRLNDALKHDGSTFTGLGPNGLQLWREALGWSSGDTVSSDSGYGVSKTTGITTGNTTNARRTTGGLSASGIITGSAAYGQWCLSLRDRLQALNDFYQ